MSWIERACGCTGLRVPLPGRWQLELWFCPANADIPEHVHERMDGWLVFLGGSMVWARGDAARRFGWRDTGRCLAVPAGCPHAARVCGRFGAFAVIERWRGSKDSAARDFTLLA